MEKGFIFKTSKYYYFIKTNNIKKSKKLVNHFTEFFTSRYNEELTTELIQNLFNTIYNNIYHATIKRSDDFTQYFIYTKHNKETISEDNIIYISV